MTGTDEQDPSQRDSDRFAGLSRPEIGYVVCPGLYAGRIDDRVKVGYSLNLPQRVHGFRFEELIGLMPVAVTRLAGDSDRTYAYRVRDRLRCLEWQIHEALADKRIKRLTRCNANEWFRFDDDTLRVLFERGVIVARARPVGAALPTARPAVAVEPVVCQSHWSQWKQAVAHVLTSLDGQGKLISDRKSV